jgi:hypothetical protein
MDPELKTAVERMHNCTASFIEDVVVVERFGKETVWSGWYRSTSLRSSQGY